jgi:hypothetical protein
MSKRKKTAKQVNQEQIEVAAEFRSNVRVSEDGQSVTHTYTLPRYETIQIRGDHSIVVDNARAAGQSRQVAVHQRGLKKQLCDGTKTKIQYKDKKSGKVLSRKLTEAEKQVDAIAHADLMLAWYYGDREKASRRDSVDVVTHECRAAVVAFVCENMSDSDGEKYTQKSVPSSLTAATCVADVERAAKQIGVPTKYLKAKLENAKAIAKLRESAKDLEVNPADLI